MVGTKHIRKRKKAEREKKQTKTRRPFRELPVMQCYHRERRKTKSLRFRFSRCSGFFIGARLCLSANSLFSFQFRVLDLRYCCFRVCRALLIVRRPIHTIFTLQLIVSDDLWNSESRIMVVGRSRGQKACSPSHRCCFHLCNLGTLKN